MEIFGLFGICLTILIGLYAFASCNEACTQYFSTQLQEIELTWLWAGFPIPILGALGIWLALKRFLQTDELINLQIRSQNQQRFFDAVRLLESEKLPSQITALETIRFTALDENFHFSDEAFSVLKHFIDETSGPANWWRPELSLNIGSADSNSIKNSAFLILATIMFAIQPKRKALRKDAEFIQRNLSGLETDYFFHSLEDISRTYIHGMQFFECDLRKSQFAYAIFVNVSFNALAHGGPACDLSKADFTNAKFQNVNFGSSNISETIFERISGLQEIAFLHCVYDFDKPPIGLPSNFILSHPKFRIRPKEKEWHGLEVVELDSSCIQEFCEKHPNFKPHNHEFVITV